MAKIVDKQTVIEASTVYQNGTVIGNNVNFTLPEVVPVTAEVKGFMGNMNIPLLNTFESMELTISKDGIDKNAAKMTSPGNKNFMFKWVQDQVDSSGNVKPVGCKAEINCLPKTYAGGYSVEIGSNVETDFTYEVYEYKLYVNGTLTFHINRLTGKLKSWNGKQLVDHSAQFNKLL